MLSCRHARTSGWGYLLITKLHPLRTTYHKLSHVRELVTAIVLYRCRRVPPRCAHCVQTTVRLQPFDSRETAAKSTVNLTAFSIYHVIAAILCITTPLGGRTGQHDLKVIRCKAMPNQPKSVRIVLATLFYASPHHARQVFWHRIEMRTATRLHQDLPVCLSGG